MLAHSAFRSRHHCLFSVHPFTSASRTGALLRRFLSDALCGKSPPSRCPHASPRRMVIVSPTQVSTRETLALPRSYRHLEVFGSSRTHCKLLKVMFSSLWHGRGRRFDPDQVHQIFKYLRITPFSVWCHLVPTRSDFFQIAERSAARSARLVSATHRR